MFLNREQQKEANPPYRELDINMDGCINIYNICFLHDPTGSFGPSGTGGCTPLRKKSKMIKKNYGNLFTSKFSNYHDHNNSYLT